MVRTGPAEGSTNMGLVKSVGRWAVPAAGLLSAATICLACNSSTSGSPNNSSGASVPTVPSVSVPSITGIPSISGIPSITGIPSIGGDQSNSAFCKDLNGHNVADLGSVSDPTKAIALWDKLAADAPSEIKADVQAVDDYLHGVMSGNVNPSDASKLATAGQHIGTYYAGHCVTS